VIERGQRSRPRARSRPRSPRCFNPRGPTASRSVHRRTRWFSHRLHNHFPAAPTRSRLPPLSSRAPCGREVARTDDPRLIPARADYVSRGGLHLPWCRRPAGPLTCGPSVATDCLVVVAAQRDQSHITVAPGPAWFHLPVCCGSWRLSRPHLPIIPKPRVPVCP
jgi:hypothetical protein